jgi:hypothetical protein
VHLSGRPVRSIAGAIADAAARWSDGDFPPRVRVLDAICERTGYSLPVVEYGLDRLFGSITYAALCETIRDELGSLDALDGFVERAGRPRARALSVGTVCVVSSRTTVGVAIVPAIFALCAKCDVVVKDREDALVASFFATLGEEGAEFARAAVARAWDGARDVAALDPFDAVVAFGDDATLAQIRASMPPAAHLIPFGSKASFGYVAREALTDVRSAQRIAQGAARDLVLYDTQGCLSLHALFVERGGAIAPDAFAAILARAIERAAVEFPPGVRDPARTAAVAGARDLAAFRAAGGLGAVYSDADASFVAVLDPPDAEPPAFLARTLAIHSVDSPAQAAAYLARHRIPLEAAAIAGKRGDVIEMALRAGVSRIASFGDLQSPPVTGNHGGRPRVAEFVRWIDDET